jgi:hypothetical protein
MMGANHLDLLVVRRPSWRLPLAGCFLDGQEVTDAALHEDSVVQLPAGVCATLSVKLHDTVTIGDEENAVEMPP